jgi:hypothetical protein
MVREGTGIGGTAEAESEGRDGNGIGGGGGDEGFELVFKALHDLLPTDLSGRGPGFFPDLG